MTGPADDDPRIDALFTLAPQDFTAARNALVRELRGEGHRQLADDVAALRRPTAAAWAVNQAVRAERALFDQLLAAGAEVRAAQRRALSGVRRGGMREATRMRRDHIEQLTDVAVQVLTAHGIAGDSHRGDIVATFDAASADDEAAAMVTRARLSQALPVSSGFGALRGLTMLAGAEPATEAAATIASDADEAAADEDDAARQQQVAIERRAAIRGVEDARRMHAEAQATVDRAAAEAERADARWTIADRAATAAEDKARRLRDDADELAGQADRARSRVTEAQQEARQLADALRDRESELQALD